jgi:hypothetical protein
MKGFLFVEFLERMFLSRDAVFVLMMMGFIDSGITVLIYPFVLPCLCRQWHGTYPALDTDRHADC